MIGPDNVPLVGYDEESIHQALSHLPLEIRLLIIDYVADAEDIINEEIYRGWYIWNRRRKDLNCDFRLLRAAYVRGACLAQNQVFIAHLDIEYFTWFFAHVSDVHHYPGVYLGGIPLNLFTQFEGLFEHVLVDLLHKLKHEMTFLYTSAVFRDYSRNLQPAPRKVRKAIYEKANAIVEEIVDNWRSTSALKIGNFNFKFTGKLEHRSYF